MSKRPIRKMSEKVITVIVMLSMVANMIFISPNIFANTGVSVLKARDFETLKEAVESITTSGATIIELSPGDYNFTETLNIVDKDITFKLEEASQVDPTTTASGTSIVEGQGVANFKRANNFSKTMINVSETSKLALESRENKIIFEGEGRTVGGDSHFIYTKGQVYINGASFQNIKVTNSFSEAPIMVVGDQAYLELNEGLIQRNNYSGRGNAYSAGAIMVRDGARMVMNGGEIINNQATNYSIGSGLYWADSPGVGGLMITEGGHLVMNGGTISGNKGFTGGILVGSHNPYTYDRRESNESKLTKQDLSTAIFNGGTISRNAGGGGGGISGGGNVDISIPEESNLLVDNNRAYQAGGIFIIDWAVDGIGGSKEITRLPIETWEKHYAGKFYMAGGTISNNYSYGIGGGLLLSSNGCHIVGGNIINNYARDYGGGIGVSTVPYTVKMENAYIAENKAQGSVYIIHESGIHLPNNSGGGVWFCPTGSAEFYAENGAALVNNKGVAEGDEFWSSNKVGGNKHSVTLGNRLIGGTRVNYYEDWRRNRGENADPSNIVEVKNNSGNLALKAVIDEDNREITKKLSKLIITGNQASKGGGIGSNANIIFGKKPGDENPLKDILVIKSWEEGLTKEAIEVEVRAKVGDLDYLIERFTLNQENNFEYIVKDLPATVGGQKIEDILYVKELGAEKYDVTISDVLTYKPSLPDESKYDFLSFDLERKWIDDNPNLSEDERKALILDSYRQSDYERQSVINSYDFAISYKLVDEGKLIQKRKIPISRPGEGLVMPEKVTFKDIAIPKGLVKYDGAGNPNNIKVQNYSNKGRLFNYNLTEYSLLLNKDQEKIVISLPYIWAKINMPEHEKNWINPLKVSNIKVFTKHSGEVPESIYEEKPSFMVNIENKRPKVSVVGKKIWEGGPEERPAIRLELLRNGQVLDSSELANGLSNPVSLPSAGGSWTYVWTGLEKYDALGKAYDYSVRESEVKEGDLKDYKASVKKIVSEDARIFTFEITNKYDRPKTRVEAKKIWIGGPQVKPTIGLQLYRNSQPFGQVVELKNGQTSYVWENLDKKDENGNDYVYTVDEAFEVDGYSKKVDGLTITNTYTPGKTNITGRKIWIGGPQVKPTISLQLYRNNQPFGQIVELKNGQTTYVWENLDKEDENGNDYVYTVDEVGSVDGYSKKVDGLTITNTYIPEKTNITGRKIWVGGPQVKPTISLQLYRNNQPFGQIVELKNGQTTYVWENLDKEDENGNDYVYTVDEVGSVDGYSKKVDGLTITNTYTPGKTSITGRKVWVGGSEPRPSINLQLYRDGVELGEPVKLLNGQTTYTWDDLPLTDDAGNKYKYTVDEITVLDDYTKKVDGLTIINTYIPPTPEIPEEPGTPPETPPTPEIPEEPGTPPETPPTPEIPEGGIPGGGVPPRNPDPEPPHNPVIPSTGIPDGEPPFGGPKTGDDMPVLPLAIIASLSLAGAFGLIVYKKKKFR